VVRGLHVFSRYGSEVCFALVVATISCSSPLGNYYLRAQRGAPSRLPQPPPVFLIYSLDITGIRPGFYLQYIWPIIHSFDTLWYTAYHMV